MKKEYIFLMFSLCFGVWVIAVDNLMLPSMQDLRQDVGAFSRYRVKEWRGDGKLDLMKDKILLYAHVKGRERIYYVEHMPCFEATLKQMEPGRGVQLRYTMRFPKVWQRTLYEVRADGVPVLRYSPLQLKQRQAFIWKFSGVMAGIFILLSALGFLNKKRR